MKTTRYVCNNCGKMLTTNKGKCPKCSIDLEKEKPTYDPVASDRAVGGSFLLKLIFWFFAITISIALLVPLGWIGFIIGIIIFIYIRYKLHNKF